MKGQINLVEANNRRRTLTSPGTALQCVYGDDKYLFLHSDAYNVATTVGNLKEKVTYLPEAGPLLKLREGLQLEYACAAEEKIWSMVDVEMGLKQKDNIDMKERRKIKYCENMKPEVLVEALQGKVGMESSMLEALVYLQKMLESLEAGKLSFTDRIEKRGSKGCMYKLEIEKNMVLGEKDDVPVPLAGAGIYYFDKNALHLISDFSKGTSIKSALEFTERLPHLDASFGSSAGGIKLLYE